MCNFVKYFNFCYFCESKFIRLENKQKRNMGLFGDSSEENNVEEKMIDSMGHVNNNIIIQEAKDTHAQVKMNEKMLMTMYIMCGIETIKLIIYLYNTFKKNLKKKYQENSA